MGEKADLCMRRVFLNGLDCTPKHPLTSSSSISKGMKKRYSGFGGLGKGSDDVENSPCDAKAETEQRSERIDYQCHQHHQISDEKYDVRLIKGGPRPRERSEFVHERFSSTSS